MTDEVSDIWRDTPEPPAKPAGHHAVRTSDANAAELDDAAGQAVIDVTDAGLAPARICELLEQAAASHSVERTAPVGAQRSVATVLLRDAVFRLLQGRTRVATEYLDSTDLDDAGSPSTATLLGVALELMDQWHDSANDDALMPADVLGRVGILPGHWNGGRAARDILAMAQRGAAFAALGYFSQVYSEQQLRFGAAIAVASTISAWSAATGIPPRRLLDVHVQ